MAFSEYTQLIPSDANNEMYNLVGVQPAVALNQTTWARVARFKANDAKSVMLCFGITANANNLTGDDMIEWYLAYEVDDQVGGANVYPIGEHLRATTSAYGDVGIQAGPDNEDFFGTTPLFNHRYFTSQGGGSSHLEIVPLVSFPRNYVCIYMRGHGRVPYEAQAPTLSYLAYALSAEVNEDLVTPREMQPVLSFGNSTREALGGGATFTGAWEDMLEMGSLTVSFLSDVATGATGLQIQWTQAPATGAMLAENYPFAANVAVSFTVRRKMRFGRVVLQNGAGAQQSMFLETLLNPYPMGGEVYSTAKGTSPAMGITGTVIDANHNALDINIAGAPASINVDVQGNIESLNGPDPSSVRGALGDLPLLEEPTHALRTRGEVHTDAGTFAGNFPNVSLYRAINGGLTLTTGITAWARANTVTPLRVGDYVEIIADHNDAVPVMAQIATIANNGLSGTLQAAYAGAGGVLAAAQVSDWYVYIAGAGAAIAVGAGLATLNPAVANPARCTLARYMGPGGRKGCPPLWARFVLGLGGRFVNEISSFGLASNLDTVLGIVQGAYFSFNGANPDTDVVLVGSRDTPLGIVDIDGTAIPGGGAAGDPLGHLYEVLLLEDQINWYIDRQRVGTGVPADYAGQQEIPDPYSGMYLFLQIENVAAVGGAANLWVRDAHCKSLDIVDVRCVQPDGSKLHVTVDTALPVNVDLQGQIESRPGPDPSSVRGALGDLALLEEPDHALRTRARVLTDEGVTIDDFNDVTGFVYDVLPGTLTLTPGVVAFSGSAAAFAVLKAGDYVQAAGDDLPATPAWTQIASLDPATLTGVLVTAYAGAAGGVAVAAWRSTWLIQYSGAAGPTITTAASVVSFTMPLDAAGTGLAYLIRRLGFAGRKGCRPVRMAWNWTVDQIRANQLQLAVLCNAADPLLATMIAGIQAISATQYRLRVAWDGYANAYDYTLPGGGATTASHAFELEWTDRGVTVWIDRVLAWPEVGPHLGDQYVDLYAVFGLGDTGATGGATVATMDLAIIKEYDDVQVVARNLRAEADLDGMARCLPGFGEEEGLVSIPKTAVATTLCTAVNYGVFYWVQVLPTAAGDPTRVRLKAPGPATANSMWLYSTQTPVAIGPLQAGQTISCWVDAAEPAAVDVQYARIS